jgi:predicted metal-dependent peptidase
MTTNTKAEFAFSKARSDLLLSNKFFFFGRLSLFLKPVQTDSVPTMATNGKQIVYNPDFFLKLTPDLQKSAIAHEVLHCSNRHFARQGARKPGRWNAACDYAINPIIKDAGFRIGDNWLHNPAFAGMSAEEIYNQLPDDYDDPNGGASGAWDQVQPANGNDPSDPQMTPQEVSKLEQEWKVNVAQTAFEAERQSKMPSNMKRTVDEMFKNKVPWRDELHMFFNSRSKDDYSWMRPNRMFAHTGIILPSMYSERMGPIDVVIDTSGSITNEILSLFGAEIRAIHSLMRPERTRVIYADAAVNHVDVFSADDMLEFNMHGGGGTDFRPAIQHAIDNDPPVALVYLTDMYGSFPQSAPDFPVLWCATSDVIGPFGRTIRLED